MSSNGINTKASAAAAQGRVDETSKKLASLNLQDPEAKASHDFTIYKDPIHETTFKAEDSTPAVELNEVADKENARPAKNESQAPLTPADNPTVDIPAYTPFNSVGIHRLARNWPVPARRPLADMMDFEKEQEKKNAHFVKRLNYARQQLENRDKELDELKRLTRSIAMERRVQRDAAHKDAPVGSPLKNVTAATDHTSPAPSAEKKKDILHLKSSSRNKIAKSSSSGWTAINHRKYVDQFLQRS